MYAIVKIRIDRTFENPAPHRAGFSVKKQWYTKSLITLWFATATKGREPMRIRSEWASEKPMRWKVVYRYLKNDNA